ncbi:MAG: 2Fe-2S iron-sulfur cluster binding domain-containing protein [Gammaproteobacteria bacterium]|nr:2Fe-2S iron-sulfur cluster binding domain-containing protein [Gammaproteobacteria bacterium]
MSLVKSERSFSAAEGQSLLEAAAAAGLRIAQGCRGGSCGACGARLLRGEIEYPHGPPLGLSAEDRAAGRILLCQARARSDLEIEVDELRRPEEVIVKRLPCRIERVQRLAHDVLALYLKLPSAETFAFRPGQYLDVILGEGRRRSFSIASAPHDGALIELHVRRVEGGEFTAPLFAADPHKRLLTIEGPLGRSYEAGAKTPQAPLLCVAGGTGYAPINAILRDLLERGRRRDLHLYFGARTRADLYAEAHVHALRLLDPTLAYVPVLSEPSPDWAGRRGLVHEAVLADHERLDRFDVYVCGPPGLIEAARRTFAARGADPSRIFFDSFDYAPDALARQRSSASTRD